MDGERSDDRVREPPSERRVFLARARTAGVVAALAGAYGTLAAFAARYLYPTRSSVRQGWQLVTDVRRFALGSSMTYVAPNGAEVALARQAETGFVEDFIALSNTCPHLGCKVHWEAIQNRFFCPCHNGAFDARGKAIAGPPAEAKQELPKYPLKIEDGLLYIHVPLVGLTQTGITQPGHDACLLALRNTPHRKLDV